MSTSLPDPSTVEDVPPSEYDDLGQHTSSSTHALIYIYIYIYIALVSCFDVDVDLAVMIVGLR